MSTDTVCVIVGAGPCGLFQVFELGLLGIHANVVDSLPYTGGQCTHLYPDKPIYDIPALPVCGAQELVDRLEKQIAPFSPTFHLGQEVNHVARMDDGRFEVRTSKGTEFHTHTIIIAGGVGSFQARPLRLEGVDRYAGDTINYAVRDRERFAGKHLIIMGGGDSALDWTLDLVDSAASLTLIHRREGFRAAPASVNHMKELVEQGRMKLVIGKSTGLVERDGRLAGITVKDSHGEERTVEGEEILVFYGLAPNLGPIKDWGLKLQKNQIVVDTARFQTSIPGIFAVGDINFYPGKKKLILSGFHEAALAAFAVQHHIDPEKKQFLQYTTTSPTMHERLGVDGSSVKQ